MLMDTTTRYFTTLGSPIGTLVITGDGVSITGLYTPGHRDYERAQTGVQQPDLFGDAAQQLREYFAGTRKDFDLALKVTGTGFQRSVWQALTAIPYGETRSYAAIGALIQKPEAARAVGSANGRNPLLIFIPCHRVVAANGALCGYAGGEQVKLWLLQHERSHANPDNRRANGGELQT